MSNRFPMLRCLTLFLAILILILSCQAPAEKAAMDQISYNYDIRPILSDRCFACHGPDANKREAGLRLDIADSAYAPLRETASGFAIVPGHPEKSELIRRISSEDPTYQMPTPASHLSLLTPEQVDLFRKWIEQGAKYEKHWAFVKPEKKELPRVKSDWLKNEIDYFVLQKLQKQGLEPNEQASPALLIKRAALDLTGLLPTTDEVTAFEKDPSDKNYEAILDRYLASDRFGEKMAVHWLDVSRYSDSYGYQDDNIRTQWPYRDWVIHAFNSNMHYDQFIRWQLAGDLIPEAGKEAKLATAFLRNHKYTEEGGVVPEEYRVEYIIDKVKTYSKGILGLTAECAQCHDHKYDPISQKDYYRLFAFFNSTKEQGYEGDVTQSKPAKTPVLNLTDDDIRQTLSFIQKQDTGILSVSVMEDLDTVRTTYLLQRGQYALHGDIVHPAALRSVMPYDSARYSTNRLGLADWTVSKENPLTARVFVNQLWEQLFGRGIVNTAGDFGMQGTLPSHPALLDWLAVDFMEQNWDIKRLLKKMLMSATYRQSSERSLKKQERDPDNIYLSYYRRIRLTAEGVRDLLLSSSGLLNGEIGGPSVKPYQPAGLWESASSGRGVLRKYVQDHDSLLYRRGMYQFIKLTVPPPSMIIFDASNRDQCEVKRVNTNTPLQALVMMNDPTMLEAARVLAERTAREQLPDEQLPVLLFRKLLCRAPGKKEQELIESYYKEQLSAYKGKSLDAKSTLDVGEFPHLTGIDTNRAAALSKLLQLLYNMEEAITKT